MVGKTTLLGAAVLLATVSPNGTGAALSAQATANPYQAGVDVRAGSALFDRHCSRCHGITGTGGEDGPDLTSGQFRHANSDAGLFGVISEGIPDTQMMGLRRGRTDQAVWQLVAFLRSLSGGVRVEVPGDPARGLTLYAGKGDCSRCHMIDGEGGLQGPDLSTIGSRRNPVDLASDLTTPDERVQPAWWRMRVTHQDGTTVEGRRMNEGTYSVRILDADDRLWSFMKRDLVESERFEESSMPSYADTFTDAELDDVVAYLYDLVRSDPGR